MVKELIRWLGYWIYRFLPKFNYAVVYGWPDYEDTALALQDALEATPVRRVYFFITGKANDRFQLKPKTRLVQKDGLIGRLCFLFARYVFFTHRCFMWRFPPNVVSVNIWHGMPIKRVGWMLEGNRGITARYTIATSPFWAEIMQKAMLPLETTLVTGLPRTDRLFSDLATVRQRLDIPRFESFAKRIAWLPTYRKSVRGELRHDGRESGNIFGMPGMTADILNTFLAKHDAFALVKPHPMAPLVRPEIMSHLAIIDDQWLREKGLTLYAVLGQMDVLVTDISSIMVGFLILNRPIIHNFPDLAEYESSRGFSINPITDYLVGPVATNMDDLLAILARVIQGDDSHAEQRNRIRALFHQNPDNQSTSRLLKHLELLP